MTHIITVTNNKGGVGKTTTALSLGTGLAYQGRKVLLIDLDAQSNLTMALGEGLTEEGHVGELLNGSKKFSQVLQHITLNQGHTLDLLPSTKKLLDFQAELAGKMNRERILAKALKGNTDRYDYVIIDTPPTLDLLTNNALFASTSYIVPLEVEYFSYMGLSTLITHANEISEDTGLSLGGVVFTRYNPNQKGNILHALAKEIRQEPSLSLFDTNIRESLSFTESQLSRKDIFHYAPQSKVAQDYANLVLEVIGRYES
jgi:chromosome partitioning protein